MRTMLLRSGGMALVPCTCEAARALHERWHSLHEGDHKPFWDVYLDGCRPCYCCLVGGTVCGVLMFGEPSGEGASPGDVELRGFAMADCAPRNAASMAIAMAGRLLVRDGMTRMVTYSILEHFDMAVYKASGFALVGVEDWGHFKVAQWTRSFARAARSRPSGHIRAPLPQPSLHR